MRYFLVLLTVVAILTPFSASSAIQGDINGDGKIDATEAIFALQVTSGLYPAVSPSCMLSGQGIWSQNTAYVECDVVTSDGETYVCTNSHTSTASGSFADDMANWDLLSLKGDIGPTGPAGSVGQAKGLSIGNTVTNPVTGEVWLDRNLGASRVAISYNDTEAYGDLYQWGRGADGHESRTSPTTTVLSSSDVPRHDNFIITTGPPNDWRDPQNINLWQGEAGTNNPCPAGFRLPTVEEWEAEIDSWSSVDSAGAFASPLKLVVAGIRYRHNGVVSDAGINGLYWSATVNGSSSRLMYIYSAEAALGEQNRAFGFSVRCIED